MTEPGSWMRHLRAYEGGLLADVLAKTGTRTAADVARDNAGEERRQRQREPFEEELKSTAAAEHAAELEMRADELQRRGLGMGVQERFKFEHALELQEAEAWEKAHPPGVVDAEEAVIAAEKARQPRPKRVFPWVTKKQGQALEAANITEPATKHDLDKVTAKVDRLQTEHDEAHGWSY